MYPKSGLAGSLCTLLILALTFQSCKEDTIINANVTPAVDNINTFGIGPEFGLDTMTIRVRTVYDDSAITNAGNYLAAGWVNGDPNITGTLSGSVFFQVVPPGVNITLADRPDSGFVILPYGGFAWGDTTTVSSQKYYLYQINDNLSHDSTYYSFHNKKVLPNPIGEGTLVFDASDHQIVDSVPVYGINRVPHLRLKLYDSVLERLTQFLKDTSNTGSNAVFLSRFNGFAIMPDTTNPAGRVMPYFQLDGVAGIYSRANMLLYKHGTTDTSVLSFPYSAATSGYFNRITRRYADPALFDTLSDKLMVQNAPGAAIDIVLPYVKSLPQKAIINKAQIVLTKVTTVNDDKYFQPARIYPIGINDFGTRYSIADRYPLTSNEGLDIIDGKPRVLTIGGVTVTQYIVNVPRELQQAIALQKSRLHLRINGTQTFPGAYRIVSGSRKHPDAAYRFAFNIVYSKLK